MSNMESVSLGLQVVIGADYPSRAPEFRVRFISGIPEKKPRPVSDGSGNSAEQAQGDIRLVETEVGSIFFLYLFYELENYL